MTVVQTNQGQYFPVQLEQPRLLSSLLYGFGKQENNTRLLTVEMDTVRIPKYRQRNGTNQNVPIYLKTLPIKVFMIFIDLSIFSCLFDTGFVPLAEAF